MLVCLQNITKYNLISIFGMHFLALLGALAMQSMTAFGSFIDYKSFSVVLGDSTYWLCQLVGVAACILPVEAVKAYLRNYVPNNERVLLYQDTKYVAPWLPFRGVRSR